MTYDSDEFDHEEAEANEVKTNNTGVSNDGSYEAAIACARRKIRGSSCE